MSTYSIFHALSTTFIGSVGSPLVTRNREGLASMTLLSFDAGNEVSSGIIEANGFGVYTSVLGVSFVAPAMEGSSRALISSEGGMSPSPKVRT